jgi:hypothetical protein
VLESLVAFRCWLYGVPVFVLRKDMSNLATYVVVPHCGNRDLGCPYSSPGTFTLARTPSEWQSV